MVAAAAIQGDRGLAAAIPPMLAKLLEGRAPPQAVAVLTGPGSFTGLRAGIAAATGIGIGAGIPVVGVTAAEALREAMQPNARASWIAIDSRRGHLFLDIGQGFQACPPEALPAPSGPVAIGGDAAILAAATLAARGFDVCLSDARLPRPEHVAAVAARRLAGKLPALAPLPLYVDPPEARPPA